MTSLVAIAALALALADEARPSPPMVDVGPGIHRPLYPSGPEEAEFPVPEFRLDRTAVTNEDFVAFVRAHPEWRRDRIPSLYADEGYLSHWTGPDAIAPEDRRRPVTRVSWFAARTYCEARGARLPTEAEWEMAAAASATSPDGRDDPAHAQRILSWYARPGGAPLPEVGHTEPNHWGVQDLHGLVWEWIEDYNSALVSVDNREQGGADIARFCGAGALAASDRGDYAGFMRIAFRSALQGSTTTSNLGFRCADGGAP